MAKDWDQMTEAEKVATIEARLHAGHTSVVRYEKLLQLRARANAFEEAISFLASQGFAEASAALEAVAFERVG